MKNCSMVSLFLFLQLIQFIQLVILVNLSLILLNKLASCNGDLEEVRKLLTEAANIESTNFNKCTPLIWGKLVISII